MRISDWSSDVCSSDLGKPGQKPYADIRPHGKPDQAWKCRRELERDYRVEDRRGVRYDRRRRIALARSVYQVWGLSRELRILHHEHRSGSKSSSRLRGPSRGVSQYRSEEHTSELQSLMRISYAVFCLKTKTTSRYNDTHS